MPNRRVTPGNRERGEVGATLNVKSMARATRLRWGIESNIPTSKLPRIANTALEFLPSGEIKSSPTSFLSMVETFLTAENQPNHVIRSWRNPAAYAGVTASSAGDIIELPGEGYPKFFDALGVVPTALGTHAQNTALFDPMAESQDRTRQIRAVDVALITPRVASSQTITLLSSTVDSQDFQIETKFNNAYGASHSSKYRLLEIPKWTPQPEPTAEDRFNGTAVEPDTDQIRMATIYMVSQENPDGGDEAVPDGTWTPFVQYSKHAFWNLAHMAANPQEHIAHSTLTSGLAGGIADRIFANLLAPVNDAYNQAVLASRIRCGISWRHGSNAVPARCWRRTTCSKPTPTTAASAAGIRCLNWRRARN